MGSLETPGGPGGLPGARSTGKRWMRAKSCLVMGQVYACTVARTWRAGVFACQPTYQHDTFHTRLTAQA
jgi:hypothetical protein